MLARLDSRELTYWQAMYRIDPWGSERGDLQAGIVAATVFNVNRDKSTSAASPSDFRLEFGEKEKQTPEEMARAFEVFTVMAGGEVRNG